MRVNLRVPYEERHEAKRKGARWDAVRYTWYVMADEKLDGFLKWVPAKFLKPCADSLPKLPKFEPPRGMKEREKRARV